MTKGQFGPWNPVAVEKNDFQPGYKLAFKNDATNQFIIWNLDDAGNYISADSGVINANSYDVTSYETIFQQDLNNDGTVGTPITLVSISPEDESGSVSRNPRFTLTFDQAVAAGAGSFDILRSDQPDTPVASIAPTSADVSWNGNSVSFNLPPATTLDFGTSYFIRFQGTPIMGSGAIGASKIFQYDHNNLDQR